MRLLKTDIHALDGHTKLELIEAWGSQIPPYAILSHLWSRNAQEEVVFDDVRDGSARQKPAVSKICKAMVQAKKDGYQYLWVDTCCIDKTSSAELSEAINSMYRYYQNAGKCYAYLADAATLEEGFEVSRWWQRGFCLQELIAPKEVIFFSATWHMLGTKIGLHSLISRITGIDSDYLLLAKPIQAASIAQRMCWAARRETTREEDIAYCLMGIFDVNMPMLYGEGRERAFLRLQQEIMLRNEDQSIFAWVHHHDPKQEYSGMLAKGPEDFRDAGSVIPYSMLLAPPVQFALMARGLRVSLPLVELGNDEVLAILQCQRQNEGNTDLAIYLKRLANSHDQYIRIRPSVISSYETAGTLTNIYVRQHFNTHELLNFPRHVFWIHSLFRRAPPFFEKPVSAVYQPNACLEEISTLRVVPPPTLPTSYRMHKHTGTLTVAMLLVGDKLGICYVLMLGAKSLTEPGFDVVEMKELGTLEQMQTKFHPKPMGSSVKLRHLNIQVAADERLGDGQKIYQIRTLVRESP